MWHPSRPVKGVRPPAPAATGVLRKRFNNYVATANWLADELQKITRNRALCAVHRSSACGCVAGTSLVVTCEFPEYQTGASRSMGWMRGDLQKLTYLVGVLSRMSHDQGAVFEPVPVSQWKGQLPKDIVIDRIQQALGTRACTKLGITTHAWDATGIGLWRLGVFK
jgi:hypothetical protein